MGEDDVHRSTGDNTMDGVSVNPIIINVGGMNLVMEVEVGVVSRVDEGFRLFIRDNLRFSPFPLLVGADDNRGRLKPLDPLYMKKIHEYERHKKIHGLFIHTLCFSSLVSQVLTENKLSFHSCKTTLVSRVLNHNKLGFSSSNPEQAQFPEY